MNNYEKILSLTIPSSNMELYGEKLELFDSFLWEMYGKIKHELYDLGYEDSHTKQCVITATPRLYDLLKRSKYSRLEDVRLCKFSLFGMRLLVEPYPEYMMHPGESEMIRVTFGDISEHKRYLNNLYGVNANPYFKWAFPIDYSDYYHKAYDYPKAYEDKWKTKDQVDALSYVFRDIEETNKLFEKFINKEDFKMIQMDVKTLLDQIKEVKFNDPATIILWKDGSKTVVKCQNDETFDPEKGLMAAIIKKLCLNKGNFNDIFRKWLPKEEMVEEPKVVFNKHKNFAGYSLVRNGRERIVNMENRPAIVIGEYIYEEYENRHLIGVSLTKFCRVNNIDQKHARDLINKNVFQYQVCKVKGKWYVLFA